MFGFKPSVSALKIVAMICFVGFSGCNDQPAPPAAGNEPAAVPDEVAAPPAIQVADNQQAESKPATTEESDSSLLNDAAELLRRASESGQDGASSVADWVSKRASDGAGMASDSADWVGDMFTSLKDQGLTTADNAKQWVQEDFQAMGRWEYKIEIGPLNEKSMNELGAQRWECFHMERINEDLHMYFKRPRRSYLRNIPMKDLLKLMPMLNQDN